VLEIFIWLLPDHQDLKVFCNGNEITSFEKNGRDRHVEPEKPSSERQMSLVFFYKQHLDLLG
jgi:hypothetical protein